jgi:kynurenine formamidase
MTGHQWGRWGTEDQRGALNLVNEDAALRAAASIRSGQSVSLALEMRPGAGPRFKGRGPLQHFMSRHGGDYAAGLKERGFGFADDYFLTATGGTTHLDSLAHVWRDGLMWNGISANTVTSRGASRCGIETAGPIVTRAIFVDLDDRSTEDAVIQPGQLRAAVAGTGIVPAPGDALLVRTGWLRRWRAGLATEDRWGGLSPDCAEWIGEQDFALIGADNIAVEFGPSPDPMNAAPMHVELIRNRGIFLMELLDLERLAGLGRQDFMLCVAPMPLVGGVASPVNPVAVL